MGGHARVVIVEGVPGVGKSSLVDALVRRYVAASPERQLRTLIHLTQTHTYGPLAQAEDDGSLTAQQNLAHLDTIVRQLSWYERAAAASRDPKFFAVVDTLHLTHCCRPGVVAWEDVASYDRRLADAGARLLFLRATPATLLERLHARRETQFFTGYAARKWGPSLETVHEHFVAEQDAMRELLLRTRLPYRELAADAPLKSNLDAAYDFWID